MRSHKQACALIEDHAVAKPSNAEAFMRFALSRPLVPELPPHRGALVIERAQPCESVLIDCMIRDALRRER